MVAIRYTCNLFLRAMCVVYLFAFISFYIQIPGLYGDNGILPARGVLENTKYKSWSAKVHYQPTLLWLAPNLGLDTQSALDVLALLGTFLAFTGFVSQKFCTIPLFAGLWSLYFSLFQIGQVFVTSQWDNLLLEAGFLCLLVAPLLPGKRSLSRTNNISFWLVRWLLFRFTVSSGVVKLLSGCPKWWSLTALQLHHETMILPSPLSWYSHYLPEWYLKMVNVTIFVSELFVPFLFFIPVRSIRISSYSIQLFLQIFIVLTGNFNFLNLLVVTLLLSLLDDKLFFGKTKILESGAIGKLGQVINIGAIAGIIYGTSILFSLKINGTQIDSKISFTKDQYDLVVKQGILAAIYIGFASLALTIVRCVSSSITEPSGVASKISNLFNALFYGGVAMLIFVSSTVPLSALHSATNSTVVPEFRTIHHRISKLQVANEYGNLFKRMPSGRLEIILEGSNNIEGPWLEYHFLYKPGNVNSSLPFVAPYSPRIDWQIWWAAQSTYKDQPWLLSLTHRLLQGRPEVLALFDRTHSPFQDKPPKYIRGILYNYKYTSWSQRSLPAVWRREKINEYFPAFSKDSPALVDYLKARNLLPTTSKESVNPIWERVLGNIRYLTSRLEATLLLWSIFTAGCAIIATKSK